MVKKKIALPAKSTAVPSFASAIVPVTASKTTRAAPTAAARPCACAPTE